MMTIVYQTDKDGYFIGPSEADESPLEPGVFLVPAGCVTVEPPKVVGDFRLRWTGASWDAVPVTVDPPQTEPSPPPTLAEAKAFAIMRINSEAGAQRALRITVITGQEGTYLAKQEEGARFARGEFGPFPYLQAEADATGQTLAEVAILVNTTAAAWTLANAAIEGKRRGALVAVEKAAMISEVDAIFPIAWPAA